MEVLSVEIFVSCVDAKFIDLNLMYMFVFVFSAENKDSFPASSWTVEVMFYSILFHI